MCHREAAAFADPPHFYRTSHPLLLFFASEGPDIRKVFIRRCSIYLMMGVHPERHSIDLP